MVTSLNLGAGVAGATDRNPVYHYIEGVSSTINNSAVRMYDFHQKVIVSEKEQHVKFLNPGALTSRRRVT